MADRRRPDDRWELAFPELPALDALGQQIAAAAREDEWRASSRRSWWLLRSLFRRGPRSVATVLLVLVTGLAGAAYAASRLIDTGQPVPRRAGAGLSGLGAIVPGTTKLLAVRAADPDGGPPWGLRVFRTHANMACVQIGRVVDGKLGVLGQDGVFHDDGRFHELPVQADGCGSLDGAGQLFASGGANAQTASGYDGEGVAVVGGCETSYDRGLRLTTVRTLQDALRLQLRRGEKALARVQRRVIARYQARARKRIALCPTKDLRNVVWGFEGAQAQKVTLTEHGHTTTIRPQASESGAYIAVLRGTFQDHPRLKRRTFYGHGVICGRGFGVHPTTGCSPPPGAVPTSPANRSPLPGALPRPRRPARPPASLHVPIVALPGLSIRFTPPADGHRYSTLLICRPGLYGGQPSRRLQAGKPQTLRIRGPLPTFCSPHARGQVVDANTGQRIGTFRLRSGR